MQQIEDTMLAYVAGIIDGEGCITINRYRPPRADLSVRYTPYLQVGNSDRPLIELLQGLFGGLVMVRPPKPRHKEFYVWQRHGPDAAKILEAVQPYLRVKSRQCDLFLDFVRGFRSYRGGPRTRRVHPDELARRATIYEGIKRLNRPGPPDPLPMSASEGLLES